MGGKGQAGGADVEAASMTYFARGFAFVASAFIAASTYLIRSMIRPSIHEDSVRRSAFATCSARSFNVGVTRITIFASRFSFFIIQPLDIVIRLPYIHVHELSREAVEW